VNDIKTKGCFESAIRANDKQCCMTPIGNGIALRMRFQLKFVRDGVIHTEEHSSNTIVELKETAHFIAQRMRNEDYHLQCCDQCMFEDLK